MTENQIPEAAVKAAWDAMPINSYADNPEHVRRMLEAAAPHMQTDLLAALVDAMSAWAGDKELGFMEGALEAAEEALRPGA